MLDNSIGFLLTDAARLVRRTLYWRLARYSIRGGSWFVLRALWEQDGPTQRELSTRLGTTQSSTFEMLRTMEADGLVRFERDTEDRRKLRVYLTERAHSLKSPLAKLTQEANEAMLSRLSITENMVLKNILQTLRETLIDEIAQIANYSSDSDPPAALNLQDEAVLAVPKPTRKKRTVGDELPKPKRAKRPASNA